MPDEEVLLISSSSAFYAVSMLTWIRQYQVVAVALTGGIVFLLWEFRFVAAIVFAGYIVAAALRPVVDALAARHIPRILALALTYICILGIFVGLFVLFALPFVAQAGELWTKLNTVINTYFGPNSFFAHLGFSLNTLFSGVRQNVIPITLSFIDIIAAVISILVISIYLVYEGHDTRIRFSEHHGWKSLTHIIREVDVVLGAWIRGELLLAILVGVLVGIALFLLHVPFAPVLGVFAGFMEFIPYAGPFISAIPGILLAASMSLSQALFTMGAYILIQQLEAHIFVPLIMKNAVRLHPVLVITTILIGYEVLGIVGMLLSIPFACVLQVAVRHISHAV